MTLRTVHVSAARPYDVLLAPGLLAQAGRQIARVVGPCRAAVITDTHVQPLYLAPLLAQLRDAGIDTVHYTFAAGEASKNLTTLGQILEILAQNHLSRQDVLIALGGGVVGDIVGFAAAVYLRGVRYVQVPTTLLAAVDSSVGGKTAVDLPAGKNLVGAFKQPELVLCDPQTFSTLPRQDWISGMAEAIKYGVLYSRPLFDRFTGALSDQELTDIVEQCVRLKAEVVALDEFDTGQRCFLNLGHTFGHAIERCSSFAVPHGHGVAAGMAMMARAGEAMGITAAGTAAKIEKTLTLYGLPIDTDYPVEDLVAAAQNDKKRAGQTITLVIPQEIGRCLAKEETIDRLAEYARLGKRG